jgi:hypothetical protein
VLEADAGGDLSTVRTRWARPNLTEIEGVTAEITVEDDYSTARITHTRGGEN